MVLMSLLTAVTLTAVILSHMVSQARLGHHKISRIQAYYAAMAGINFAIEQLRTGAWSYPANCQSPGECLVSDANFPPSISQVQVILCPAGTICQGARTACTPPTGNFCVNSTATYTFTNP